LVTVIFGYCAVPSFPKRICAPVSYGGSMTRSITLYTHEHQLLRIQSQW